MIRRSSSSITALVFAALVFLGSCLLFQSELIFARLLLPTYGSSASVWTTCLMFYQALLFLGYLQASWAVPRVAAGTWRWRHLLLVAGAALFLPFTPRIFELPPVLAILLTLLATVGPPFLVLSTTSVMAQAWFTTTDHPRRDDPYFLYGTSNAGSLVGLVSYPLLVEPALGLDRQLTLWTVGYGLYALLTVLCLASLPRVDARGPPRQQPAPVTRHQRWLWLLLAAGPSALLMAVSNLVTLDAPIPLLWILPLTLYLLTLIVNFGRRLPSQRLINGLGVVCVLGSAALLVMMIGGLHKQLALMGLMSLLLFYASLRSHHALAAARPTDTRQLGRYFLFISLGGGLGSALIGLVAPVVFSGVASFAPDLLLAGGVLIAGLLMQDPARAKVWGARLAAGGGAALLLGLGAAGEAEDQARTFYGLYRVVEQDGLRRFVHGNTIHGLQRAEAARRGEALAYYHQEAPIGRLLMAQRDELERVGIVGLGVGTLATYALPGQRWDYYELDPEVVSVARERFHFLEDSAGEAAFFVGDARLTLSEQETRYDLLVIDVFSSDFVPTHMLTREAVALYRARLTPGGVLAFHITNRIFDLQPVLARLADEAGATPMVGDAQGWTSEDPAYFPSLWYAFTWDPPLAVSGWEAVAGGAPRSGLWTDDHVNLLEILR